MTKNQRIRAVFLAAADELERRELCKGKLAMSADYPSLTYDGYEHQFWRRPEAGATGRIYVESCADITACCAIGSLDLAGFCRAELRPDDADRYTWDALTIEAVEILAQVLLDKHEREIHSLISRLCENGASFFGEDDIYYDPDEVMVALRAGTLDTDSVGSEGLVPLWNDADERTKEEVVAALLDAAESLA